MQILFAGSASFLTSNLFLLPAIVMATMIRVVVASFTMLALSALSKSTRERPCASFPVTTRRTGLIPSAMTTAP